MYGKLIDPALAGPRNRPLKRRSSSTPRVHNLANVIRNHGYRLCQLTAHRLVRWTAADTRRFVQYGRSNGPYAPTIRGHLPGGALSRRIERLERTRGSAKPVVLADEHGHRAPRAGHHVAGRVLAGLEPGDPLERRRSDPEHLAGNRAVAREQHRVRAARMEVQGAGDCIAPNELLVRQQVMPDAAARRVPYAKSSRAGSDVTLRAYVGRRGASAASHVNGHRSSEGFLYGSPHRGCEAGLWTLYDTTA